MDEVKKTILVIDDEDDLREAIITALNYENFNAIGAKDGEEGLAFALEHKPNLIFLDMVMPKMNGLEMLKELRKDEWGSEVKVVVMTVLDDMEKIAEVVEEGGDEYIIKTDISLGKVVEKAKEKLG